MAISDTTGPRTPVQSACLPQDPATDQPCCNQCGAGLVAERPAAVPTCVDCREALEMAGRMTRDTGAWWF